MGDYKEDSPAAATSPAEADVAAPADGDEPTRALPRAALWIEEVRIRNFRGLPDVVVRLERDLTILVGRNNAGKSRILRAISLALGASAVRADRDDFTQLTVSTMGPHPEIDVIVAPAQTVGDGTATTQRLGSSDEERPLEQSAEQQSAERFEKALADELRPQLIDPAADRSRWAFRTTIRGSLEGLGAQLQRHVLTYTATTGWALPRNPTSVLSSQLRLLQATLIGDRRDLATDLTARGSAIARILDDLEVSDDVRPRLEDQLRAVSDEIATHSASLKAVRDSVQGGSAAVGGIGKPVLNPLPPTLEEREGHSGRDGQDFEAVYEEINVLAFEPPTVQRQTHQAFLASAVACGSEQLQGLVDLRVERLVIARPYAPTRSHYGIGITGTTGVEPHSFAA